MTAWQCRRLRARLVDLADGALPREEEKALRAHAAACDDCGAALEALEAVPGMLRELDAPAHDEAFWANQRQSIARRLRHVEPGRAPWLDRRFAWGAGLAAAAVLALTIASQRGFETPVAIAPQVAVEGLGAADVIELADISEAWNGELDAIGQSGLPEEEVVAEEMSGAALEPESDAALGAAARDLDDEDLERLEDMIG